MEVVIIQIQQHGGQRRERGNEEGCNRVAVILLIFLVHLEVLSRAYLAPGEKKNDFTGNNLFGSTLFFCGSREKLLRLYLTKECTSKILHVIIDILSF